MTIVKQLKSETQNRIKVIQTVLTTWAKGTQEFTDDEIIDVSVAFLTSFLTHLGQDFPTIEHLKAGMQAVRDEKREKPNDV